MNIQNFVDGYISAALFSSTDKSGKPLGHRYQKEDIDELTFNKMRQDCIDFCLLTHKQLQSAKLDDARAGVLFYWNRSRVETGYFDETPVNNQARHALVTLSQASHHFSEVNLYSHKGRIYS